MAVGLATLFFFRKPGEIVTVLENVIIVLINGLCWGVIYGGAGYLIDRWRGSTPSPSSG